MGGKGSLFEWRSSEATRLPTPFKAKETHLPTGLVYATGFMLSSQRSKRSSSASICAAVGDDGKLDRAKLRID